MFLLSSIPRCAQWESLSSINYSVIARSQRSVLLFQSLLFSLRKLQDGVMLSLTISNNNVHQDPTDRLHHKEVPQLCPFISVYKASFWLSSFGLGFSKSSFNARGLKVLPFRVQFKIPSCHFIWRFNNKLYCGITLKAVKDSTLRFTEQSQL